MFVDLVGFRGGAVTLSAGGPGDAGLDWGGVESGEDGVDDGGVERGEDRSKRVPW